MTTTLVLAVSLWTFTHFIAHFGIALGYLVAMTRNTSILSGLMRISWWTKVCGFGFFLFCGVTHIGLATGTSKSLVITVCDHLQLVAIWGFIIGLLLDGQRMVLRLSNAFEAIRLAYDGLPVVTGARGEKMIKAGTAERMDAGSAIVATINFALHGKEAQPPLSATHKEQGQEQ